MLYFLFYAGGRAHMYTVGFLLTTFYNTSFFAFFQREIYYRERLRAYVCYTGRFVVGRGRGCSDGCGLHSFEVFAFVVLLNKPTPAVAGPCRGSRRPGEQPRPAVRAGRGQTL